MDQLCFCLLTRVTWSRLNSVILHSRSNSEKFCQSKNAFPDCMISSWDSKLRITDAANSLPYCDCKTIENSHLKTTSQQYSALKSNGLSASDCLNTEIAAKASAGTKLSLVNGQRLSPCSVHVSPVAKVKNVDCYSNNQSRSEARNYRSLDRRVTERKLAKKMSESCESKINCYTPEPVSEE